MHIIIFINFEPTKYQIIFQGLFKLIICRFTHEKKCRYNLSRSPVVAAKFKLSNNNKVWFKDNNRYLYYSYCFFTFSIFPFFWFRITATNCIYFFSKIYLLKRKYIRRSWSHILYRKAIFFSIRYFSTFFRFRESWKKNKHKSFRKRCFDKFCIDERKWCQCISTKKKKQVHF